MHVIGESHFPSALFSEKIATVGKVNKFVLIGNIRNVFERLKNKKSLSEVGFEPTPTEVDCDLNAAP